MRVRSDSTCDQGNALRGVAGSHIFVQFHLEWVSVDHDGVQHRFLVVHTLESLLWTKRIERENEGGEREKRKGGVSQREEGGMLTSRSFTLSFNLLFSCSRSWDASLASAGRTMSRDWTPSVGQAGQAGHVGLAVQVGQLQGAASNGFTSLFSASMRN